VHYAQDCISPLRCSPCAHLRVRSLHFMLLTAISLWLTYFSLGQLPLPSCTPHGGRTLLVSPDSVFLFQKYKTMYHSLALQLCPFLCPINGSRGGHDPYHQRALDHSIYLVYPVQIQTGVSEPGVNKLVAKFSHKAGTNQRCCHPLTKENHKQLNPK